MMHVACESKLRSVVRPFMHPCPGNWLATGHVVVYFARADIHLVQEFNVCTIAHTKQYEGELHARMLFNKLNTCTIKLNEHFFVCNGIIAELEVYISVKYLLRG